MQVETLKGETVNWKLTGYPIRAVSKSKFQHKVGQSIIEHYPHDIILEEIPIPKERLTLDFFIPSLRLAVECQGEQHQKFSKFYHGTRHKFNESIERDTRKRRWCELNNIRLVYIRYTASDDEILMRLRG
jgi:hypothetical protein